MAQGEVSAGPDRRLVGDLTLTIKTLEMVLLDLISEVHDLVLAHVEGSLVDRGVNLEHVVNLVDLEMSSQDPVANFLVPVASLVDQEEVLVETDHHLAEDLILDQGEISEATDPTSVAQGPTPRVVILTDQKDRTSIAKTVTLDLLGDSVDHVWVGLPTVPRVHHSMLLLDLLHLTNQIHSTRADLAVLRKRRYVLNKTGSEVIWGKTQQRNCYLFEMFR